MDTHCSCNIISLYKSLDIDIYQRCKDVPSTGQYAAIDAHIENLELPLITDKSFCGVLSNTTFCIKDNKSLQISILAIIGTYTKIGSIIFFIDNSIEIISFLNSIADIRSKRFPGAVVSVFLDKSTRYYNITDHNTRKTRVTDENGMVLTTTQLVGTDRSMTFYLSSDFSSYAPFIHNNRSIWIYSQSFSAPLTGSISSEIMPILYMKSDTKNTLRLNIGKPYIETQKLNVIQSQLDAVISSIISAMSKDNLCFCCAFMKRIHSVLCSCSENVTLSFNTALLTDFIRDSE